jgi:hypothetical protein
MKKLVLTLTLAFYAIGKSTGDRYKLNEVIERRER